VEESPVDRLLDSSTTQSLDDIRFHGNPELQSKLQKLVEQHKKCFAESLGAEPARVEPFELDLKEESNWYSSNLHKQAARPQSHEKFAATRDFIQKALEAGIIEPSQSESWSQVLLTPKSNGKWRFCIDFRYLNLNTKSMGWPLPNIRQMLERIGARKPRYFAVLDLTQGYYQAAISVKSRPLTAFRTADGLYQWKRLPMGLKGAPAFFQHAMQHKVLADLLYTVCEVYLDDIIVYAETEEEFLANLQKVLQRLEKYNITLNPAKVQLGMSSVEYVGHTLDSEGLSFSAEKREDIWNVPLPQTKKQLKSFLGMCVQFKDHVRDYSTLVQPLHDLLPNYSKKSGHEKVKWTETTTSAFYTVRQQVNDCPKLFYPDSSAPVFLHTDASDYGIGGYLYQQVGDVQQPIVFLSKSLNKQERRWTTYEKEGYAIFYCLMKMEHLLRDSFFTLRTDHKNLTFINTDMRQKVKRWKLAIQHYDFDIEHIAGDKNIEADGFSRLLDVPDIEEGEIVENICVLEGVEAIEPLPSHIYEKIKKVHNTDIGHFGLEKSIEKLRSMGVTWAGMRKDVRKFLSRCPCCQKMSFLKLPIHTRPFTLASYSPFDRVYVDTIGPLPEVEGFGFKYIIVIVDAFSRFVKLHPAQDTTAESALAALLDWVGLFGIPSELVSDNGSQFANELVTAFLSNLETTDAKIHAYSKEENGVVERANKEVNRHLRTIIYNRKIKTKWHTYLPLVQRIMNASVHTTIGVSPAQIVFGNSVSLDRNLLSIPSEGPVAASAHISDLLQAQSEIIGIAQKNQIETDQFHIAQRGGNSITEFPINSYVLVNYEGDDHRPPSKLHTHLRGPLRVVNFSGPVYTLQNLVTNKLEDFHVKLLHPFRFDPSIVDPEEVAQHDEDYYDVLRVVDHKFRGRKKRRSDLEFLVHYEGDQEPSWVPWSADLGKNGKVHEYLESNSLRKYIPIQFTYPKDHPLYVKPLRKAKLTSQHKNRKVN